MANKTVIQRMIDDAKWRVEYRREQLEEAEIELKALEEAHNAGR